MANEKVSTDVDVTQPLIGFDGKPIADPKIGADGQPMLGEDGTPIVEPVPFRMIACVALDQVGKLAADRELDPKDKMLAYRLAHRISINDKVTFSPEELTFLEKRIGIAFAMNVVGAAGMILNPGQMV